MPALGVTTTAAFAAILILASFFSIPKEPSGYRANNLADGYSAQFSFENLENPEDSYSGKLYVNLRSMPRAFRRDEVRADSERSFIWRQRPQFAAVVDPKANVYWVSQTDSVLSPHQTSRREYLGEEVVQGRKTLHYREQQVGSQGAHEVTEYWEDISLGSRVRELRPGKSTYTLSNIRIGAQPASVFDIPSHYKQVSGPSGY